MSYPIGSNTCKVKGFSLKRSEIGKLIHYDAIKKLVKDRYHDQKLDSKVVTSQSVIVREKRCAILKTVKQCKELRVQYTKGNVVVHEEGTVETLPFGYGES